MPPRQSKRKKNTPDELVVAEEEVEGEEVLERETDASGAGMSLEALMAKMDAMAGSLVLLNERLDKLQPLETVPARLDRLQQLESVPSQLIQLQHTTQELVQKFQHCEQRLTSSEQKMQTHEALLARSAENISLLQTRLEAAEGAMRRRRLRLVGLDDFAKQSPKELLSSLDGFFKEVLKLPLDFELDLLDVLRLSRPTNAGRAVVTYIIELRRIATRDELLRRYREASIKGALIWKGQQLHASLFPDYAPSVMEKRRIFQNVKKLAKQMGIEHFMRFPADLILIVEGQRKVFHTPATAEDFLKSLQSVEMAEMAAPSE